MMHAGLPGCLRLCCFATKEGNVERSRAARQTRASRYLQILGIKLHYHARMVRRAQHLRCFFREARRKRAGNKLDKNYSLQQGFETRDAVMTDDPAVSRKVGSKPINKKG